jgi:hypothetical protein
MIYEGIGIMHDPRTDLERLPSENLFDLARNDAATHRKLAIQLLVERGSHLACRDEFAAEARDYVLNDPIVLKRIDPASAALATAKLPNIIDCLAHEQTQRVELSRVVSEHNAAHTQKNATLESIVNDNKAVGEQALAQAYELLWGYFARQGWELAQAQSDQKLDTDKQLQELRSEHQQDNEAASERLRLLERSAWQ